MEYLYSMLTPCVESNLFTLSTSPSHDAIHNSLNYDTKKRKHYNYKQYKHSVH